MTIAQLARQFNIPAKKLERDSIRAFLLTKLGEIEASRHPVLKKYTIESAKDWDEKARQGKAKEEGYTGIADYFQLDELDSEKETLVRKLLTM